MALHLGQDLLYALRLWRRNPGLVAMAIVALTLGIGATTTVFSVVRTVLVRPLPYQAPDQLVFVWEHNLTRNADRNVVSPGNFIHWDEQNRSFTDLAAVSGMAFPAALSGVGEPREVQIQIVSASFFPILGVKPVRGRTFLPDEDRPKPNTVVISHRLWQSALAGDPNIVGRSLTFNGLGSTVVGVMPEGFGLLDTTVDAWFPIGLPPQARTPRGRWMQVIGRLRPGVSRDQAQADMEAVASRLRQDFPAFNTGWTVNVVPFKEQFVGRVRTALLVLFAAITVVLLIACANVANLLLAQASARQRELAVRTALGAGRGRLVRQLLVESGALASAGGLLGLALAWVVTRVMAAVPPNVSPIPRLGELSLDLPIVTFALVISLATGLLFGAAPALSARTIDLSDTLKEGSRGAGMRRGAATRAVLVTVEMALAIVLLAGAGLLVRSFLKLTAVPLGWEPRQAVTVPVSLPNARYQQEHQIVEFYRTLLADLSAAPGVTAAGAISWLPMAGLGSATTFEVVGKPKPPQGEEPVTDVRIVSGDLFGALGVKLLRGRTFSGHEAGDAARVVVVNRTMADTMWPGEDPIGRRLRISWRPENAEETVIGVVEDIRTVDLVSPVRPMIFWPHTRSVSSLMHVIVRGAGGEAATSALIAPKIRARDAELPVAVPQSMESVLAASVRDRRLTMTLLAGFAGFAVLLAAVGVYGVMAYTVGRRTQEIGVRLALGAQQRDVLSMILSQTLRLAASGVAIGLVAAWAVTRVMRTLLFEVEPGDPLTLGLVALVLAGVGGGGGGVAGRPPAPKHPHEALRYE
jgi:putative ABC transport system permease protein